jgi:predicted AlkP superfamily pyrophosphatase or phosphodiesterase
MRPSILIALLVFASGNATALRAAAASGPPKLVVLLSVDQLRADYVERYRGTWSQGLHRLFDGGAWFRQARFTYAHTVTCAGHATISTGTQPATHGMILNEWWDRETGRNLPCTQDDNVTNVGYGMTGVPGGDGPGRLRVVTLADVLRTECGARVVSLSLKARSAITLAGQRAEVVLWMDGARWGTSTAYATEPPGFLAALAASHSPASAAGNVWQRRGSEEHYRFVDDATWERPPPGWGTTFPHTIAAAGDNVAGQWKRTPLADAALVELALASLDELELGVRGTTDYLAVSFSSLDYVGHAFGPQSHEVQESLLALDESLAALLNGLDERVGAGEYVVALTADHGVSPIPERIAEYGIDAGRVNPQELASVVEARLVELLGIGPHVASVNHTDLYFAPGVYDRLLATPQALEAVRTTLLAQAGVEGVFQRGELLAAASSDDTAVRAIGRSFRAERSGDLVLSWKPFWIASTSAATHGTHRDYDTRVPLVLLGHGVRPGQYFGPADPVDVAPTLAFLAQVTLPGAEGRVLSEALIGP